jgi:DeoR family glycerol-3-phosphate regulon repressor
MKNKQKNPINKRQRDIINFARKDGFVTVENLSEIFQVTHQTIRRDLTYLSDNLYLARTHGGAFFQSGVSNVNHYSRQSIAQEEKIAIANKVSALIPDNSSVVLNIGTTTEQVAKNLLGSHQGLKIITNNINIVNIAAHSQNCEIWVAGGKLRIADNAIVGSITSDFITNFKIDYAIVGISAIDSGGTLLDFDHEELMVTKAIYAQSRKIILIADANKFDRKAPYVTGHLRDVDTFVTDKLPNKKIVKICKSNNVELIISPPNS